MSRGSYSRELSYDPASGTREIFHWDEETKQFSIETVQEVDLEANRAELLSHNSKANQKWKGDMHKVASLPLNVWMDLQKKGIIKDSKAFKRWLNDPDNAAFRTKPGRV